jgi:hypothetical protein
MRVIILIFLSIFLPVKAVAWEFTKPCQSAIDQLNNFLASASNTCQLRDDCDNAYITANSCFGPVVMAKSTLADPKFNKLLLRSQTTVAEACRKDWREKPFPACVPMLIPVDCYHGKCIDARERAD